MQAESATAPRQRNPLRLSVRGLVVLVLVIGAGLGWVVRQAHVQRDAVATIQRAGGTVMYDWQYSNGRMVSAGRPPQWLVDLIGIDHFGHVTAVWLTPMASDVVLAQVERLSRLVALGLLVGQRRRDDPSDEAHQTHCASLYGATDRRRRHGEAKTANALSFLCLHHTHVTDEGLAQLKGLSNLSQLDIVGHSVTLAAARELNRALPSLSICR